MPSKVTREKNPVTCYGLIKMDVLIRANDITNIIEEHIYVWLNKYNSSVNF